MFSCNNMKLSHHIVNLSEILKSIFVEVKGFLASSIEVKNKKKNFQQINEKPGNNHKIISRILEKKAKYKTIVFLIYWFLV